MPDGREGKRGVRGDTGLRGDEGADGKAGKEGAAGATGARGEPGRSVLAKKVTMSFWMFGLIIFVALALMGWAIKTNRNAIAATNEATHTNTQVLALAKRVTADTDEKICTSVEDLRAAIRKAAVPTRKRLLEIAYYREHPAEIDQAIQAGKDLATARFPPVDCSKLPSVAGTKPKATR